MYVTHSSVITFHQHTELCPYTVCYTRFLASSCSEKGMCVVHASGSHLPLPGSGTNTAREKVH